ncbi:hypothetical protein BDV27DRAFT_120838 [Aspergillus caelatus]|uniref:EF-hand domain-containing protein n=1 Tax=Aspergillus caelatus TaxID=61420 RepID=A0A5N7AHL0_9EURO|nr:uncharacterized protein BDV27DRAFT_120838 [Aspergillus caelatus]KAE8369377.1 hypothetical protein BDV27DRAFT_120838 [Aspergillus caelatus]
MPPYSREERDRVTEEFHKLNKNYDDFIDYDELKAAIEEGRINLTEEDINNHIQKLDWNGDGKISFGEFLAAYGKRSESNN